MRYPIIAGLTLALALLAASPPVAQIPDPCLNYACELNASQAPCPLPACPAGDTPSFAAQGWSIDIWVTDINGDPIPNVPAADFWLIECDPAGEVSLCGGSQSSNADANTDADGKTTMSLSTLAGGGCADGVAVVAQGIVIYDPETGCTAEKCLPIWVRSPDIDASLEVNLADLSLFATAYGTNDRCADFNISGHVDLADLATFALHFGPPGHACN